MDSPINNEQEQPDKNELEFVDLDAERVKPKGKPWSNHRAIKESDLVRTTPPEKVLEIANTKLTGLRERALFLMLYICAARVEEIVKYRYIKWGNKKVRAISMNSRPKIITRQDFKNKKVGELEDGIHKANIAEEIFNGKDVIVFSIRNLKNKREHRKRIPFVLNKPVYVEMWKIIKTYLAGLSDEDMLFNFGTRRAEKLLQPTGWNPHSLRALRLTHLVRFHNFADQKLRVFSGWSDTRPAREYIKLGWEELVESM